LAAALVLSAAGLTLRVARVPEGFVQRWLATDATFLRTMVAGVGVFAGLFGAMYAVPQFLVREHGWSNLAVGAWLLPGAVLGGDLSRLASRLAGTGGVMIAATALSSAVLLGLAGSTDSSVLVICAVSLGFAAFASTQVVATGLLSARIQPAQRGGGLALLNLTFFVGGGAGSAVAGALAKSFGLTTVIASIAVSPCWVPSPLSRCAGRGAPPRSPHLCRRSKTHNMKLIRYGSRRIGVVMIVVTGATWVVAS
jgi:DHA2 family metal-tetracycline-proton antiporter-like MFS transporter